MYFTACLDLGNTELLTWLLTESEKQQDKLFAIDSLEYQIIHALELKNTLLAEILLEYGFNHAAIFKVIHYGAETDSRFMRSRHGSVALNVEKILSSALENHLPHFAERILEYLINPNEHIQKPSQSYFLTTFYREATKNEYFDLVKKMSTILGISLIGNIAIELKKAAIKSGHTDFLRWLKEIHHINFYADDIRIAIEEKQPRAAIMIQEEWQIKPTMYQVNEPFVIEKQENIGHPMTKIKLEPTIDSVFFLLQAGEVNHACALLSTMLIHNSISDVKYQYITSNNKFYKLYNLDEALKLLIEKAIANGETQTLQKILAIPLAKLESSASANILAANDHVKLSAFCLAVEAPKNSLELVSSLVEGKPIELGVRNTPDESVVLSALSANNADAFYYLLNPIEKHNLQSWHYDFGIDFTLFSDQLDIDETALYFNPEEQKSEKKDDDREEEDDSSQSVPRPKELYYVYKVYETLLAIAMRHGHLPIIKVILEKQNPPFILSRHGVRDFFIYGIKLSADRREKETWPDYLDYFTETCPEQYRISVNEILLRDIAKINTKAAAYLCSKQAFAKGIFPCKTIFSSLADDFNTNKDYIYLYSLYKTSQVQSFKSKDFIPVILQEAEIKHAFIQYLCDRPTTLSSFVKHLCIEHLQKVADWSGVLQAILSNESCLLQLLSSDDKQFVIDLLAISSNVLDAQKLSLLQKEGVFEKIAAFYPKEYQFTPAFFSFFVSNECAINQKVCFQISKIFLESFTGLTKDFAKFVALSKSPEMMVKMLKLLFEVKPELQNKFTEQFVKMIAEESASQFRNNNLSNFIREELIRYLQKQFRENLGEEKKAAPPRP